MGTLNSWDVTDANNNAAPPDGWPENTMAYSDVNDTGRAVQGTIKRFFDDNNGSLVGAGVADAYTLTLNESGYVAYFTGFIFRASIVTANLTTTPTIDVNGIGAITIVDSGGGALLIGALETGGIYDFQFDGTDFRVGGGLGAALAAGGADTELQYNNGGTTLGGMSGVAWNDADDTLLWTTPFTTETVFEITSTTQTTGTMLRLFSNNFAYNGLMLEVVQDDASSTASAVRIQADSGTALEIDTQVGTGILVTATNLGGSAMQVDHGGSAGSAISIIASTPNPHAATFTSNAVARTTPLVEMTLQNAAAGSQAILFIDHNDVGPCLDLNSEILFRERADHALATVPANQGIMWLRDDQRLIFTDESENDAALIGEVSGVVDLITPEVQFGEFNEDEDTFTGTTGTKNLDVSASTVFSAAASMAGNLITFTFDNPPASGRGATITLIFNAANTATVTFPASVEWPGGVVPTWSTGIDVVSFVTVDNGTTWYGFLGGADFS